VTSSAAPPGRVLLGWAEQRDVVERVASAIRADFPDGVVLVGVLKGALLFCADLARALCDVPVLVDFLSISRYAPDSGRVRILHDVSIDLAGRDVVIVEDLVDTGLTLAYLVGYVEGLGVRRVEVCTMLDRPARRIVPVVARYVGMEIDDVFVLGAGLHYQDRYRNLPAVIEADRATVVADPDAYRAWYRDPAVRRDPGGTLDVESEATA
jgi:hypoxanthine phosphoribosyltransferase